LVEVVVVVDDDDDAGFTGEAGVEYDDEGCENERFCNLGLAQPTLLTLLTLLLLLLLLSLLLTEVL
jgi:hypothetical protein